MNSYRETITLRSKDCDMAGSWRFSSILSEMQEAAGIHSDGMGCGREKLLEKGVVWVLARTEVRMARLPKMYEQITIETFHTPMRHRMFPRFFIFTDAEGMEFGTASSLWMLMDVKTRESVSPESIGLTLSENTGVKPPMGMPGLADRVEGEARESLYHPVYTEIDVNQHVNNTRYADWICNQLGTDILRNKEIGRMVLDYNAEVRPEQEVLFQFAMREDKCRMTGLCEGKKAFEISCDLRDRNS